MSRTLRYSEYVGVPYGKPVPEGKHRKLHYRCRCSWCMNYVRNKARANSAVAIKESVTQ